MSNISRFIGNERGDKICHEDDGCPTELAVLKRFWREQQASTLPTEAPNYRIADRGFRWDAENRQHIPQLLIEFTPVPANEPNDSKGWKDRDSLAAILAAAPTPPVSECVDPVMTKEELIAAAESIGMRFHGASIPPVSEDQRDAERLNWLDEQGMIAIGQKGYGEYRYYAGDLFPAIRQVIDQAMQEDKP